MIKALKELQLLPKGSFKVNDETGEADLSIVNVFYSDCKFSCGRNYHELFMLPNGSLFISESILSEVLRTAGIEGLMFLLLT